MKTSSASGVPFPLELASSDSSPLIEVYQVLRNPLICKLQQRLTAVSQFAAQEERWGAHTHTRTFGTREITAKSWSPAQRNATPTWCRWLSSVVNFPFHFQLSYWPGDLVYGLELPMHTRWHSSWASSSSKRLLRCYCSVALKGISVVPLALDGAVIIVIQYLCLWCSTFWGTFLFYYFLSILCFYITLWPYILYDAFLFLHITYIHVHAITMGI